jgi:mRNA-degrading endonuclease RelE of RelBE toxin-antitoxin system
MTDTMPLAKVKAHLSEVVDRVIASHERVAAAVAELLTGDLLAAPRRLGKPLRRELAGIWSARRGSYRVLYEIDEEKQRVVVLRVDHRADVRRPYR